MKERPSPIQNQEKRGKHAKFRLATALVVFLGLRTIASNAHKDPVTHIVTEKHVASDFIGWEIQNLPPKIAEALTLWQKEQSDYLEKEEVRKYFSSPTPNSPQEKKVEKILARQVNEVLEEEGIRGLLPPVFEITGPQLTLIVSRRDNIAILQRFPLKPDLPPAFIEGLERTIEQLPPNRNQPYGLSALVVENGGSAASLPPTIIRNKNLVGSLEFIAHEWLHGYLMSTDAGREYFFDAIGMKQNYEAAIINETLANIAGKEIGRKTYVKNYGEIKEPPPATNTTTAFDFDKAMRQINNGVKDYLSRGEIEEAEKFMQEERQKMLLAGHQPPRRINQAYFAFNGAYADSPLTIDQSVLKADNETLKIKVASPTVSVGELMTLLRKSSPTLKEFIETAGQITRLDQLKSTVEIIAAQAR